MWDEMDAAQCVSDARLLLNRPEAERAQMIGKNCLTMVIILGKGVYLILDNEQN